MATKRKKNSEPTFPPANDWRTTDRDEVEKRRARAREEAFAISNIDARHPIFSNFRVQSGSGLSYSVEIRCVRERQFSCDCVDFRINGLGTCKHVEAVLLQVERRFRRVFAAAKEGHSTRIDIVANVVKDTLCVARADGQIRGRLLEWFDTNGELLNGSPDAALSALEGFKERELPGIRVSQDVKPWIENRQRSEERKKLRHEYELKV